MRQALLILAALAAFSSAHTANRYAASAEDHAQAASRGLARTPAPSLTLKTVDGQVIDFGELYGKKAV